MEKWYSKRLEGVAAEIEALISVTPDEDAHYYLSEALSAIIEADEYIGISGVTFA